MNQAFRSTRRVVVSALLLSAVALAQAGTNTADKTKNTEHHSKFSKAAFWRHQKDAHKNAKQDAAKPATAKKAQSKTPAAKPATAKQSQAKKPEVKPVSAKQPASKAGQKQNTTKGASASAKKTTGSSVQPKKSPEKSQGSGVSTQ